MRLTRELISAASLGLTNTSSRQRTKEQPSNRRMEGSYDPAWQKRLVQSWKFLDSHIRLLRTTSPFLRVTLQALRLCIPVFRYSRNAIFKAGAVLRQTIRSCSEAM